MARWSLVLLVVAVGCNGNTDDPTDDDTVDTTQDEETGLDIETDDPTGCNALSFDGPVSAKYLIAPNWNQFALAANPSRTCEPTGESCDDCWHGGENRVVMVATGCTCGDLTVRDSLNAFEWTCSDPGGSKELSSLKFRPGKGLGDLIDPSTGTWREMSVIVSNATDEATSDPAVWWTNPIVATTGGALDQAGTIYLVNSDITASFSLEAEGVALVVAPDATVTGESGVHIVSANGVDYVWVEGTFDASLSRSAVMLDDVDVATVHRTEVVGPTRKSGRAGIVLSSSRSSRVGGVTVDGGNTGIELSQSHGSCVRGSLVADAYNGIEVLSSDDVKLSLSAVVGSGGDGIRVEGSERAELRDLVLADIDGRGLLAMASPDLRFWRGRIANSGRGIIIGPDSPRAVLSDMLVANNVVEGVTIEGENSVLARSSILQTSGTGVTIAGDGGVVSNLVAAGSSGWALGVEADRVTVVDAVMAYSSGATGWYNSGDDVVAAGTLLFGQNASGDCSDEVAGSGLSASCGNEGSSSALVTTSADLGSSFVGRVTADDEANASDDNGISAYDDLEDWAVFSNLERCWGPDASFPVTSDVRCEPGDTCRISDWGLVETDTVLFDVNPVPTGNDVIVHTWTAASSDACDEIAGAVWGAGSCTSTFLRHATETFGDAFGGDNALCETFDSCEYLPNLGVYQGHGRTRGAGAFVDGVVTGVTLRKYAKNGR